MGPGLPRLPRGPRSPFSPLLDCHGEDAEKWGRKTERKPAQKMAINFSLWDYRGFTVWERMCDCWLNWVEIGTRIGFGCVK